MQIRILLKQYLVYTSIFTLLFHFNSLCHIFICFLCNSEIIMKILPLGIGIKNTTRSKM